ncbi:MAG: undecaprenyl-diphosphate phosphatase [Planctomycetota bacterium]|nr:undecaprenyl-diphosphate phosphatase [Planctomycetota bacterium]
MTQLQSAGQREALYLVVATIPIGIVGVMFGDALESLFDSPVFICAMLMTTGMILLSLIFARRDTADLTLRRAIVIGVMQTVAILPGVSRSGITIATARHLGMSSRTAAEFSLLLMLPTIGGATLLSISDVMREGIGELSVLELATAFIVSALVGYFAIEWLVRSLAHGQFKWFGAYCLALGLFGMLLI